MTTMMSISLRCPNCATDFESRALSSTNNFGAFHTDFRHEAVGSQPRQFYMHDCTKCGFSGYEQDFGLTLDDEAKAFVDSNITPLLRNGANMPWKKVERAAEFARWRKSPSNEIATIYLLAAYICADCEGDANDEAANRLQAIRFYSKALDEGLVEPDRVPEVVYLIGELYRRIGQPEEAAGWLERAEALARSAGGPEGLADLARQQRTQPQEVIGR